MHSFEKFNNEMKDPLKAFEATIRRLKGSFAILLISKAQSDTIFFAKNAVPMIIGKDDKNEIFFSSSDAPLIGLAKTATYLEDGMYGYAKADEIKIFKDKKEIKTAFLDLPKDKSFAQKEGFRFFMEKEIFEQSQVIGETQMGRVKTNEIKFDELDKKLFDDIDEITICACGTSYHAALVSSYLFERMAKIRTKVEVASEFRYKEPF